MHLSDIMISLGNDWASIAFLASARGLGGYNEIVCNNKISQEMMHLPTTAREADIVRVIIPSNIPTEFSNTLELLEKATVVKHGQVSQL